MLENESDSSLKEKKNSEHKNKELLYNLFYEIKSEILGTKIEIEEDEYQENIKKITIPKLIAYIHDSIQILISEKIQLLKNQKKQDDQKMYSKNKNLDHPPIPISENEKYENIIKYLEEKERFLTKIRLQDKLQKEAMENKINEYMDMEDEFEEMKTKLKYEDGRFLNNDRKDHEIIIIRNENSKLKNTVDELEKENNKLIDMVVKVEDEMNLSIPIKPINPSQSVNIVPPKPNPIMNINKSTNLNQKLKTQQIIPNPQPQIQPPPKKFNIKKLSNGIISNIIKNEDELSLVTQKIQTLFNKNINYENLFFSKLDGDKAIIFHQKCDKAKCSLVLVMDDDGNRFGGFTMRSWNGKNIQKKDEKAFVFSVDKNKIYPVLPDEVAIGCYPNFGPIFFGCQIRVYDNFFSKGGSTYLRGLNYATEEDYELTNGKQTFGIRELEVYEVLHN